MSTFIYSRQNHITIWFLIKKIPSAFYVLTGFFIRREGSLKLNDPVPTEFVCGYTVTDII